MQRTGFAPYAVAIHIVYFNTDDSLRVKHFVSDSNDDISDPAGKFQEALSKLVEWNEEKQLDTVAMKEFEDLYHREAYPGLGTVKKLSIMHHLELIGRYLDNKINDEMSKIMRRSDSALDYVPTQYITDFVKSIIHDDVAEYAGIEYKSVMHSEGYNLALFDPDLCECVDTQVYGIDTIDYRKHLI